MFNSVTSKFVAIALDTALLTSGTTFAAEAPNAIDNTQSIQNVISTVNGQANKMQGVRVYGS